MEGGDEARLFFSCADEGFLGGRRDQVSFFPESMNGLRDQVSSFLRR
jgi:hypothetical protein